MEGVERAFDALLRKEGTIAVVVEEAIVMALQSHSHSTGENHQQNKHGNGFGSEHLGETTFIHMLQADESKAQGKRNHYVTNRYTAPKPLGIVVGVWF